MARLIHVVGAVIIKDGLVLCAQRPPGRALAGLWEFPGGKIENAESKEEALRREISEELGCVVDVGREVATTSHEYEFGTVVLTTFYCVLTNGIPEPIEHSDFRWIAPDDLGSVEWAPADIPAVQVISKGLTL